MTEDDNFSQELHTFNLDGSGNPPVVRKASVNLKQLYSDQGKTFNGGTIRVRFKVIRPNESGNGSFNCWL